MKQVATEQGSGIESLLESKQGYIVGHIGGEYLRLNTDGHILTVAPTRSGKGVSCIIPNLLDHPGSAFIVDIRGETIERTADARLLMGQDVIVLDPYQVTQGRWGYDAFNPLDALDADAPGFEQRIKRLSQAILFDAEGRSSKEPIWDNATLLALNGALTYIKTCLPKERQTLLELKRLFSLQTDRRAAIAKEVLKASNGTPYAEALEVFMEFLTTAADRTKIPDNTVVQLMTILDWVAHKEFKQLLSKSTFSFGDIQKNPTTVYLVLPEEHIKGCAVWIRVLLEAALFKLKNVDSFFRKSSKDLDQIQRVLFVLDEFPAFGRLDVVEDSLATVAARGANLWLFVQNLAQLEKLYGEPGARQIVGNAAMLQAFNSNEVTELEYFSRVIGEEMCDVQSVTIGTSLNVGGSKGTSHSRTLSNSEAISLGTNSSTTHGTNENTARSVNSQRTRGTGDSISEGQSTQKGEVRTTATGTNKNSGVSEGTSSSESRGQSGEYTFFDMLGIDCLNWDSENQTQQRGQSFSRNWSQGISESVSRAKSTSVSTSTQRTRSTNESESFGVSHSVSHGSMQQETRGTNRQQTSQTSESVGESTNQSENWSKGDNVSITVKPEQLVIATPRQLRRAMSNGAQLLVLRGHYAFVAPRVVYFERTSDFYRFPELAMLSGTTRLSKIWTDFKSLLDRTKSEDLGFVVLADPLLIGEGPDIKERHFKTIENWKNNINTVCNFKTKINQGAELIVGHKRNMLGFYDFAAHVSRSTRSDSTFLFNLTRKNTLDIDDCNALDCLKIFDDFGIFLHTTTENSETMQWLFENYKQAFFEAWHSQKSSAKALIECWNEVGTLENAQTEIILDIERQMITDLLVAAKKNIQRRR